MDKVLDWQQGLFENIHNLITKAYSDTAPLKQLNSLLTKARPYLVKLLDESPKNKDARKELEQGNVTVHCRQQKANAAFIDETVKVSDLLNIDETRAATIMNHALQQQARFDKPSHETAMYIYYAERLYMLACLKLLVSGSKDASLPEQSRNVFAAHLNEIINYGHSDGSFAAKVLNTILKSKNEMNSLASSSDQLISVRIEKMDQERRELGDILFILARYSFTEVDDSIKILTCLKDMPTSDSTLPYILSTLLITIDISSQVHAISESSLHRIIKNREVVQKLSTLFSQPWKLDDLRSVVLLQWTLFLKLHIRYAPTLEQELELSPDKLERTVESCCSKNAFQFIARDLLCFRVKARGDLPNGLLDAALEPPAQPISADNNDEIGPRSRSCAWENLDVDFQSNLLFLIEHLICCFIKNMGRVVKTLKNRDEDGGESRQHMYSSRQQQAQPPVTATKNFEALLGLISIIHFDRPDSGLNYWTDIELFKFIKWSSDLRTPVLLCIYFDMIGSLATGRKSAQRAYEFLNVLPNIQQQQPNRFYGQQAKQEVNMSNIPRVSWTFLFVTLNNIAANLSTNPDLKVDSVDFLVLRCFLRLLKQVAKYSVTARTTLFENQQYQALESIFRLLFCSVPSELKASLFDAVSSFCLTDYTFTNENEALGNDIVVRVWQLLEGSKVVDNARDGIIYDLEDIETSMQIYPETLAFLHLLNVLLRAPITPSVIANNLQSGFKKYLGFVINHVFLKINQRNFLVLEERWKMLHLCLKIFENCLKQFTIACRDLERGIEKPQIGINDFNSPNKPIINVGKWTQQDINNLISLSLHPGFTLLCSVLSGSKFTSRLFEILSCGVESLNSNSERTLYFGKSIKSSLNVCLTILNEQSYFLQVLIPSMLESEEKSLTPVFTSMVGLDELLAFHKQVVVDIALYINSTVDEQVCLLSVNIMSILSKSPVFIAAETMAGGKRDRLSRIVSLFDSSADSVKVVYGYVQRLELEENSTELVENYVEDGELNIIDECDEYTGLDGVSSGERPGIVNSVRIAILDLLLSNLALPTSTPTFAHFLLGYDVSKPLQKNEITCPTSPNSKISCFHIILDLVRTGAIQGGKLVRIGTPLWVRHPLLSERCYQLIFRLCEDFSTSDVTMRYLRNTESFFAVQLGTMFIGKYDFTMIEDEDQVKKVGKRTLEAKFADLHQRAWLMKIIALELHTTSLRNQRSHTQTLLDFLFIAHSSEEEDVSDDELKDEMEEDEIFFGDANDMDADGSKKPFEQPLTKILEIFNTLDFGDMSEFLGEYFDMSQYKSSFYDKFNFYDFMVRNERGCDIFDIRKIHSLLKQMYFQIERELSPHQIHSASQEMSDILHRLLQENHIREVHHAQTQCITGWNEIVEISLSEGFNLIPDDIREEKIYELLKNVMSVINAESCRVEVVEVMSYVVLFLVDKLEEGRLYQTILQTPPAFNQSISSLNSVVINSSSMRIPAESLHYILKGLLDVILKKGGAIQMRGNFYISLLTYLHYTNPDDLELGKRGMFFEDQTDEAPSVTSSRRMSSYRHKLISGNISIIKEYSSSLFDVICSDACEGLADRWKTVPFTLIAAIFELARLEPSGELFNQLLDYIVKRNYLNIFIELLNRQDGYLIKLLDSDDNSKDIETLLQYLWIFESKMPVFLVMCTKKAGVEKLLDCKIIESLIECKFIDCRPELEPTFEDYDNFLPPNHEHYHVLLTEVLRLLVAIVSQVGESNPMIIEYISKFVTVHQEVLLTIMKDNLKTVSLISLEKLSLVTCLFSYLSKQEQLLNETMYGRVTFHQGLMSLFSKYSSETKWIQNLVNFQIDEIDSSTLKSPIALNQEALTLSKTICRNVLKYCRGVSDDSKVFKPLFVLTLSDSSTSVPSHSSPSLEFVIIYTDSAIRNLNKTIDLRNGVKHKINDIHRLSIDDINEICPAEAINEDLTLSQRQQLALRQLKRDLLNSSKEINALLSTIENCFVILYRHMNFMFSSRNENRFSMYQDNANTSVDTDNLRIIGAKMVLPLIEKLSNVDLPKDLFGDLETRSAFLKMLFRQLNLVLKG